MNFSREGELDLPNSFSIVRKPVVDSFVRKQLHAFVQLTDYSAEHSGREVRRDRLHHLKIETIKIRKSTKDFTIGCCSTSS